jgi:hypothetical protein
MVWLNRMQTCCCFTVGDVGKSRIEVIEFRRRESKCGVARASALRWRSSPVAPLPCAC